MKRWLLRIGIGIVAIVALAALIAFDFVRSFARSVPSYDGTLQVAGLAAPVEILRDRYAIPHIVARSYEDAAFALGYAHAQDRLWQMEMARRFVQGRLSELFGETGLRADTMMRAMGLYAAAEEAVANLSRDSQRTLSAYADGVNAYISGHKGRWPIEFVLAGDAPPELWRPADSAAVLKGMQLDLSENAFGEAARAQLLSVLGRRSVEGFFPPFSDAPLPAYLDEFYATTRTGAVFSVPDTTASDNWAVDGAHSATGKPLLANDPHLPFTIPSVWYLAHLSIPGEDMVGGTLAGVPAIVAGRNRHVAWGLTHTGADVQDLYLERLDPDDPSRYRTPSGTAEFDTRTEIVRVRFGRERRLDFRTGRHGPVMSDAVGTPFASAAPPGYVIALAWTALAPDDTTLDGLLAIDRAQNAEEFRTAARLVVAPIENIVYADDSGDAGHIGLMLPGRVPIRSERNDSLGLVPAPGWDARYDWQGTIPADKIVDIADPPSGRIATANNKTAPDDYPYMLTREWEASYRHDRIDALLAGPAPQSPASFRSVQMDVVDNYALGLKPRLLAAGPFEAAGGEAARLVAEWDGAMSAARPEPLIWAAWTRALAYRLYGDELGASFGNSWGYRTEFTLRVLDDAEGESRWCDDRATVEVEDCASRIRLALRDAVAELSEDYGDDPGRWRWGDGHKAILLAQPLGSFPYIGKFFNREVEVDGGPFTLLRGDNRMASRSPYAAIHGAGYRGIYDLANPDASLYVISTGQSGNLYSPHYDDLLPLWAKGEYVAIPTAPSAIAAATVNRLILEPLYATVGP